ncbi:MAG TPA: hypothetical protein VGC41_12105 [Kofleriaceae bacterium]
MSKPSWTIVALLGLGGIARADVEGGFARPAAETISVSGASSYRNVAEDRSIAHEGGELTGSMKFVMSDPMLGGEALKFTDLALFEVAGRWALYDRVEIAASVDFLPKQPSYTDEKPWQSASGSLRIPLGRRGALDLYGGGGHLLDHAGAWTHEGGNLEYRKPITEFLNFDLKGGTDVITLSAPNSAHGAWVTEVGGSITTQIHDPHDMFGGWLGIAYMVPVSHEGTDPTTKLHMDPQNRLDFHLGAVVAVSHDWDLFADYAVIDRGDLANAATRLPILDGGFDQTQILFGITRHISPPKRGTGPDEGVALR